MLSYTTSDHIWLDHFAVTCEGHGNYTPSCVCVQRVAENSVAGGFSASLNSSRDHLRAREGIFAFRVRVHFTRTLVRLTVTWSVEAEAAEEEERRHPETSTHRHSTTRHTPGHIVRKRDEGMDGKNLSLAVCWFDTALVRPREKCCEIGQSASAPATIDGSHTCKTHTDRVCTE